MVSHVVSRVIIIVIVQDGCTALRRACQANQDAVVKMLIEAGADVNLSDGVRFVVSTPSYTPGSVDSPMNGAT